jgi:hypothetical protein
VSSEAQSVGTIALQYVFQSPRALKTAHDNRVVGSLVGCQKVGVGDRGILLISDVQMMDDRLAAYWSEFLSECLAVLGTFALVTYTLPWLSLAFIPLVLLFVSDGSGDELTRQYTSAAYYRQTSRELKRLDSILRSHIYSSFGEQVGKVAERADESAFRTGRYSRL